MTSRDHTRRIVILSMLIALTIVLTRYLSFMPTPNIRLSLGFVPIALAGILFGPLYAAGAAALADFVGVTVFSGIPFFPGFTLTAALMGAAYGVFLHGPKRTERWRIFAVAAIIVIILQLGMETLWLRMIIGDAVAALIPERLLRTGIMLPIQIFALHILISPRITSFLERRQA